MEDVKIKAFLDPGYGYGYGYGDGDGDGDGSGDGSGYGDGDGDGSGDGYGSGDGSGYGSGYGYGSGDGYGYGSGDGYGYGDGSGYGYGDGDGYGSGYGIAEFNGEKVNNIDGVPTILRNIHKNVAKGCILQADFTLVPCYVVKGNGHFAHGSNLREAMQALMDKMFDDMPEEERIAEFIKAHPDKKSMYSHEDLFDWHHRLTGSCLAGRNAFVKDHCIDMSGKSTVEDFIALTKNAYGGSTIKRLEEAYKSR